MEWSSWGRGHIGSRSRHLSRLFGDYKVGVLIEELEPGKQSSPAHYHIHEEEHVLMLEGEATLRLGDQSYPLKQGDYVCFPAGQRAGHCLLNHGSTTCRYLVIGERDPNEVVVYPDSNKVKVRALDEIYDKGATKKYFDGEVE
ncbi:MAG TPA: cupin domain-containing protein [Polyangiales bacterium]|nr:cupin domain-containing protein [Polyangiales bacterium]